MKKKRIIEMDESTWNLLKGYSALKGISYNEGANLIISKYLSPLNKVMEKL